ncbi:hypothetical protein KJ742_06255 [Patescibacteria group bacterium]|nr:hypothetical protein [Patescibacteria group bacterium]MBU1683513.1 hypothetical protein [Patescibacteria group bacterium]
MEGVESAVKFWLSELKKTDNDVPELLKGLNVDQLVAALDYTETNQAVLIGQLRRCILSALAPKLVDLIELQRRTLATAVKEADVDEKIFDLRKRITDLEAKQERVRKSIANLSE